MTFSDDINEGSRLQNVASIIGEAGGSVVGRAGGRFRGSTGGSVNGRGGGLRLDNGFKSDSFWATIDSKLKSCSMSESHSEKDGIG